MPRRRDRATLLLVGASVVYWIVALGLDAHGDASRQAVIGLSTWLFLFISLKVSTVEQRVQTITMIGVATMCECLGSIVWGAYRYRLENLPLYVPPGHGLFYLTALRVAGLPWLLRTERLVVPGVIAGATALLARNLFLAPSPDLVGLVTWGLFLGFVLRSPVSLLYAVSFAFTMALEFYGTAVGTWKWAAVLPVLSLPAANPPAGIGAGYCAMDAVARRLAPRVRHAASRLLAARLVLLQARAFSLLTR